MIRYCSTCGAAMWYSGTKLMGYDEYTGKPWHNTIYRCPNNKIWKPGHRSVTESTNQRNRVQLGEL